MKVEELPAVVIKRAGADFSVYIPDNHPDKEAEECKRSLLLRYWYRLSGSENYLLLYGN
jgi:hypothetical protein